MRFNEIANLSDEALIHKTISLDHELVMARFRHATQQLDDTSVLAKLRKDIARLSTAAREREVAQGLPKNGLHAKHASSFSKDDGAAGGDDAAQTAEAPASGGFLKGIVDKISGSE